ncbi:MAG TPA: oligosaccharide flippase family protein [Solirubrobacteraceae bacterium]|nr:oligosaccharide flippase family protein [Solirubrobacteraceae bacterium]
MAGAAAGGSEGGKPHAATRKQIRGSSLLLGGRFISLGVNFLTQVLIVRYLSKSDFGIFAYGLSIVALAESLTMLGLDRALSRFLPIYHERGEYPKLFGTLLLSLSSVLTLGLAMALVVIGLQGSIAGSGAELTVVLILLALGPIQALDGLMMGTLAVFSKPRAIFFRRYVVAPGLQLAAIVLVMLGSMGVEQLALGYVLAGGLGLVLYLVLLVHSLRADGVLAHFDRRRLSFPFREIYGFAVPLLAVDLLFVVMNTTNVFMLRHFGTEADVATYRVVQPAARMNMLVMTSFAMLFTPLAARLFARGDREGTHDLYWVTAAWMAVFSFPVFALTTVFAGPLTVSLFGDRYASSAAIMAMLSAGYYFNAALGFNGLMLRVYGLVRYVVIISLGAALANVALNLLLIPRYGPVGAGVGTCLTLVVHNVLKQTGLRKGTGISIFDRHHLRVYAVVAAGAAALLAVQLVVDLELAVAIVLTGLVSVGVVAATRNALRVGDTFPELLRVPLLRRVLA